MLNFIPNFCSIFLQLYTKLYFISGYNTTAKILKEGTKALRKEKLEQLALKKKDTNSDKREDEPRQPSREPIKIKQSVPKTAKLLTNPIPIPKKRGFERALSMQDDIVKKARKRHTSGPPAAPPPAKGIFINHVDTISRFSVKSALFNRFFDDSLHIASLN